MTLSKSSDCFDHFLTFKNGENSKTVVLYKARMSSEWVNLDKIFITSLSSVQSLSRVRLFATP